MRVPMVPALVLILVGCGKSTILELPDGGGPDGGQVVVQPWGPGWNLQGSFSGPDGESADRPLVTSGGAEQMLAFEYADGSGPTTAILSGRQTWDVVKDDLRPSPTARLIGLGSGIDISFLWGLV